MNALYRFQAVALARAFTKPLAALQLVGLAVAIAWVSSGGGSFGAVLALLFAGAVVVWAMSQTFDAVDTVRWIAPVRRVDVLGAHLGFWLTICAPLALLVAIVHCRDLLGAAVLLVHLVLFILAAAALVMFFQRNTRRDVGLIGIVAGIVAGSTLAWPVGWSFWLAWEGRWESLVVIGVVACICTALGVPMFLREEFGPSAASGAVVSAPAPATERAAQSPVESLLRVTYRPMTTGLWVVFGAALPLLSPMNSIAAVWTALAASNLAGPGLQTWRWLASTPIDRKRAFRVLFGPPLAFVLVVTAARLVLVEATFDRSAFFRDYRSDGFVTRGAASLRLYDVLQSNSRASSYTEPEVPAIAARVRAHLREEYGLDVPQERIEADMLRGWPEHPSTGIMDSDQTAVLDAMERVRVDLADDIASAGRRRDIVTSAGLVLAFLVMLRSQFRGRVLGLFLVILCGLPIAILGLFRHDFPGFAAAADETLVALTSAPPAVFWLLLFAACAFGTLLWHSARKAFRRIDLLDLPPSPPAWMR